MFYKHLLFLFYFLLGKGGYVFGSSPVNLTE